MRFKHFYERNRLVATAAFADVTVDAGVQKVAMALAVIHPNDINKSSKAEGRRICQERIARGNEVVIVAPSFVRVVQQERIGFDGLDTLDTLKSMFGLPRAL